MTLEDHIISRIQADGPMRLDEYMSTCLLHPTLGYYTTRAPFGAAGDFVTAPEISQMFGELIGLALAQAWLDQGAPTRFTLAELGPGRGTLMKDVLRACAGVAGFLDSANLTLVEAAPAQREAQRQTLDGVAVTWIDAIDDLPEHPLFLVANEFFDALAIRQFVRTGMQWRERQVGLVEGKLAFGLGPAAPQPALSHLFEETRDGDLVEVCAAATPVIDTIARRISDHGGAALVVDYGDWRTMGDTFQAVQNHQPTDPLADPGQADLTAHVDFEALARAAAPCRHTRLTPQGVFLERLGITARAQALAAKLEGDALNTHIAAHRRLTHPQEMGTLFKVLGLFPPDGNPPPGLEP
ncbi:MAG: SAM-dependent methyltransferase [Sulfitobacter sp.]